VIRAEPKATFKADLSSYGSPKHGRELCAAVSATSSIFSPLATRSLPELLKRTPREPGTHLPVDARVAEAGRRYVPARGQA